MITTADLHWAAGFLEGEGCFYSPPTPTQPKYFRILAVQRQQWPLIRLQQLFGGTISRRAARGKSKEHWVWALQKAEVSVGAAFTLYSLLSPGRQEQIRRNVGRYLEWHRVTPYTKRRSSRTASDLRLVS